jgi:NAD(P)-dependent dehydrogenase (short-subunit alcohol dehydrogenase family)
MPALNGRRVLITGASSGIGAAAAAAFAREGADVALVARSAPGLEAVAAAAREHGVNAHPIAADLGTRAGCEHAVAASVDALGGLDLLVWNAASMVFGHFEQVAPEDFDRTIDVTFMGAVNTVRAALPHLQASGGDIVATGSLMTRVPLPTFGSYAAAKHALRGFLSSLRIELEGAGSPVHVSMVHPGPVDTPLWDNVSSATGSQPRNPPDSYAPEVIAEALVACAIKPRAEITVGLEGRALELLYAGARPVADRVLRLVDRFYSSGREPAPQPGGLWEGQGDGRANGGNHGRPSAWGALRLGRRLLRV